MTTPVRVLRTLDASPADLFDVWVSSETLVDPVTALEMDAVVGGVLRVSTGAGLTSDLWGRFLAVERPTRLRYTWRWGGFDEESVVEVLFHDLEDVTVVEVNHAGFLDDTSRRNNLEGWVRYLDSLPAFL